jgi:hypothetical protein
VVTYSVAPVAAAHVAVAVFPTAVHALITGRGGMARPNVIVFDSSDVVEPSSVVAVTVTTYVPGEIVLF